MSRTKRAALVALSAALLGIISQITLPLPSGVPITLQSFAVALTGRMLGPGKGTCAVAVWLMMGAVGLPLFSGLRGGIAVLMGPTGGFLAGFLLLALFCGMGQSLSLPKGILAALPGLILCHLFGILWFTLTTRTPLLSAAATVSLPFIPKDLLLLILSLLCADLLRRKIPLLRKK